MTLRKQNTGQTAGGQPDGDVFGKQCFAQPREVCGKEQEIIQTERGKHIKLLFIKSQMGQFAGDNCGLTQITGSNTGDVRNAESRKTGQRCSAEHRHRQN